MSEICLIEKTARLCHEINRIYCASLGDTTQPTWDKAPDWQKQSARSGVINLLSNKDATPEMSHENWLKDKKEAGWKYGPVKDEIKKEHPCIVPYNYLPDSEKIKDHLFYTIVRGMQ